jgi:hypothetical protein
LLAGGTVRADVPPPPGYKENCTLEKQHFNDTECFECEADITNPDFRVDEGDVDGGDNGLCEEEIEYQRDGYEKNARPGAHLYGRRFGVGPAPEQKGRPVTRMTAAGARWPRRAK